MSNPLIHVIQFYLYTPEKVLTICEKRRLTKGTRCHLERGMRPRTRQAFDGEKRLLGLLDLLRDGWWVDDLKTD